MEINQKAELFEQTPVPKAVFTLAIPMVIGSLVMVLYNLADTYFVGMLNNPIQNAAVTLAAPVLLAFNAVTNLFGTGCSSMMGRALGRKDYDTVRHTSAFGFYGSLCSGILFTLLCTLFAPQLISMLGADELTYTATYDYLKWTVMFGSVPAILNVVMSAMVRSEGAAIHASIGVMSGCILNMILDPFFILPWGLNMGAAGAGCATFLSNCAAFLYYMILLRVKRGTTFVSISPKWFSLNREIVTGVCEVGIPASIQNLLNVTGMTILNNFTAGFGADAVAAMGIAYKLYMIPIQVLLGCSTGIMPLISYNYGSGNFKRMKESTFFTIKLLIPSMAVMTMLYHMGAGILISAFMKNETIIAYGARFLRGFCIGMPFMCLDFLSISVFQSVGNGKIALLFAILRKIVLEIPLLFLLNAFVPLYGLAYAQAVTEIMLAIAASIMLKRMFHKLEHGNSSQKAEA